MIEVKNLKYRYPHTETLALKGINCQIEAGEFIGIIGPNGAGKSTLTQALMGLVPQFYKGAYGGVVLIEGERADTTPIATLCQKVGLVFQNPFNQLSGAKETVYEEIAFGLQNIGIPREEMKDRIMAALKLLDIEKYKDRNPFDLSGGQMQRVAIASILVMAPEVLILDEPTSQLDPAGTEEVFEAIEKLAKTGKTILVVEQKIEKIASYCDRIMLMHQGELVAFDTPQQLFARQDLEAIGVQAPAFTRICKALQLQNETGCYPVTQDEIMAMQEKLMAQRQAMNLLERQERLEESAMPHSPIFEINQMAFAYEQGGSVIQGLDLTLNHRSTAIIGQNGAGKTTLVKLLKGLLKPVEGSIYYKGQDIAKMTVATLAREVGYVFQNPDDQIFKNRVLDEVMFGPLNIGMSKEEAEKKALEALEMVGLKSMQDKNPYDCELSERKLIAIASVIAMDTKVIILDEPTIAQDYAGRQKIKAIVKALEEQGKLVIAILHDMDFVAECFKRVIVMAHGKVLADGTAEDVFSKEEVLHQAKLELPHVTSLCKALGFKAIYLTVEDFVGEENIK